MKQIGRATPKFVWIFGLSAVAFFATFHTIDSSDFFWNLASGRWMISHNELLRSDVLSYSQAGAPWVNIQWLHQLVLAGLANSDNEFFTLTLFFSIASSILTILLVLTYQNLNQVDNSFRIGGAFLIFLVTIFAGQKWWDFSGEIWAQMIGAGYLFALSQMMREFHLRWFWTVLGLQAIWVNIHEMFLIGPLMAACFAVEARIRQRPRAVSQFTRVAIGCVGVTALNPAGVEVLGAVFRYLNISSATVAEKVVATSPNSYHPMDFRTNGCMIVFWSLTFLLSVWSHLRGSKRFYEHDWGYMLVGMSLLLISFVLPRHVSLFVFWTLPWVSVSLDGWLTDWPARLFPVLRQATASVRSLCAVFAVLALVFWNVGVSRVGAGRRFGNGIEHSLFSKGLSGYVGSQLRGVSTFHDMATGSYLAATVDGFRTYLDGRTGAFFDSGFIDVYLKTIIEGGKRLEQEIRSRDIKAVIFHTSEHDFGRLLNWLSRKSEWQLGYIDEVSVIVLQKNIAQDLRLSNTSEVLAKAWRDLNAKTLASAHSSNALVARANFLATALSLGQFEFVLESLSQSGPDIYKLELGAQVYCMALVERLMQKAQNLGPAAILPGEVSVADERCTIASDSFSNNVILNEARGLLYLNTGRPEIAAHQARKILTKIPKSYEGRVLLGKSLFELDSPAAFKEAQQLLLDAAELRPLEHKPFLILGSFAEKVNLTELARNFYRKAWEREPLPGIAAKLRTLTDNQDKDKTKQE